MKYTKNLKPIAVTLTLAHNSKTRGEIKLCYLANDASHEYTYWITHVIKCVHVEYDDDYALLCHSLSVKHNIPFIPGIKRNDGVTVAQKQIIAVNQVFNGKHKDIIYESIRAIR